MKTKPDGDGDEKKGTAIAVRVQNGTLREILGRSLQKDSVQETLPTEKSSIYDAQSFPTEVRRIRRGKFFLTHQEQSMFGSFRRPIFEHWGHGVVVGEMTEDPNRDDGMWCYGAHNDFDLIPEFMKPSEWPEYTRTSTGWVRKDGDRRLEAPSSTLEKLFEWNMKQLRLK